MKGGYRFVLFMGVLLLLVFVMDRQLPKRFVWTPTFSRTDKQPFGCALFDSLLTVSLSQGYTVTGRTFYQLLQEDSLRRVKENHHQLTANIENRDTASCKGFLLTADYPELRQVDIEALLRLAEYGHTVMVAGNAFPPLLSDTLGIHCSGSIFMPVHFKQQALRNLAKDTLYWVADSAVYPRRSFNFHPMLCATDIWRTPPTAKVLAYKLSPPIPILDAMKSDSIPADTLVEVPVALSIPHGKGTVVLVSTPLLLTNYGVMNGRNVDYVFRLLSQFGSLPVVRTEAYALPFSEAGQSPFRYFLSQRPLRWALYLTLTGLLLFVCFTARRRQRAIPVIRPPENKSLEYVKLIGTLYFRRKDPADLVRKKFLYFADEIRRQVQVDVEEVTDDERGFERLSRRTGIDREKIANFIRYLHLIVYGGATVSDEEMKRCVRGMQEVMDRL